jgi:tetratricopeptide (TPR) repeat protein
VELRPDLISGWVNLGILERERGEPARAEQCLCRAFELNPRQAETLVAWCHFRVAENDVPGAWGWMRWALAANPEFDEAVNMHGILLHKAGRFEEAMEVFERAERLGSVSAASNRGNSLLDLGRVADSLHAYEAAVQRDPGNPGARYNLALTQLRMGDWERGWENYEARWKFREVHRTPRQMKQPRWRGEPLRGERILLHAEQGLGDTIQFCRYAELVVARGGVPILQVQPAAERLMRSLEVVRTGRAETATLGEKTPDAQWECPLMSLPAVFRTTVSTVPWSGPYLDVAQEMAEQKLVQFAGAAKGNPGSRRIGIAWAGNPRYKADHARSVRLKTLFPFLRSVDATWISLQKGDAAAQLADLPGDVCVLDGSTADADLAETAALMAGLDLVITTDTCVAHLAGAMGKPVWILVPWLADWRWMDGLETTPWYPSARLLRQATPGRWDELVHKAAEELTKSIYFSSVIYG